MYFQDRTVSGWIRTNCRCNSVHSTLLLEEIIFVIGQFSHSPGSLLCLPPSKLLWRTREASEEQHEEGRGGLQREWGNEWQFPPPLLPREVATGSQPILASWRSPLICRRLRLDQIYLMLISRYSNIMSRMSESFQFVFLKNKPHTPYSCYGGRGVPWDQKVRHKHLMN